MILKAHMICIFYNFSDKEQTLKYISKRDFSFLAQASLTKILKNIKSTCTRFCLKFIDMHSPLQNKLKSVNGHGLKQVGKTHPEHALIALLKMQFIY